VAISNQITLTDRSTRGNQTYSLRFFSAHGSVEAKIIKNHLLCFCGQFEKAVLDLTMQSAPPLFTVYSVDIFWTLASLACHQPCVVSV